MEELKTEFRPIDRSMHELLVVDDDPTSRYATCRVLRRAGFRIREAATGMEGLAAADDSISVMVLDVHLPDIDGFELCRRLRSLPKTHRLPVLHLTAAYVTDEDKVRGLDAGADAYLTRPVEPAVLIATVQALVRTRVAEEAMRRSELKFRAIYAEAPGGICLLDEQGRFIDANPAMLAMLGRPLSLVAGRPVSDFVPTDWTERAETFTRHADRRDLSRQEFPILDPQGRSVHIQWSISPHVEPHVNMAVAIDISQRIQLEQQRQQLLDRERIARGDAEQISRMKDDFIAVLSHELRTPLNAMMGWTHVLQKRGGTEETMRSLAAIERNGHMQARMIADLLDMSRLNLGKLPLSFEALDPAEAVHSSINAMRPAFDEQAIDLRLSLEPPYRSIRADSSRLQQAIWNLLSNAIKFSRRGGVVEVTLVQRADGVMLRVRDEGQGIAPDFLPFVFDRFSQSNTVSNRQRGGLGLGLSIVKQLVEAHGGTVSVHSEGLGKGAMFEVWLPTEGGSQDEEQNPVDSAPGELDAGAGLDSSLEGLQLLVVDDDHEANAMLQVILRDQGAEVQAAHDCAGALRLLESYAPDVLISDIGMPGQDGYDLIRAVREREALNGRHVPAIALTSFTRGKDREQAIAAGFDTHCPKPLRPLQLVRKIHDLVR